MIPERSGLIIPPPGAPFMVGLDLAMARIITEADATKVALAVLATVKDEAVQMLVAPGPVRRGWRSSLACCPVGPVP